MGKKWHLVSAEILKGKFWSSSLYANVHLPVEKRMHLLSYAPGYVILENSSLSFGKKEKERREVLSPQTQYGKWEKVWY